MKRTLTNMTIEYDAGYSVNVHLRPDGIYQADTFKGEDLYFSRTFTTSDEAVDYAQDALIRI